MRPYPYLDVSLSKPFAELTKRDCVKYFESYAEAEERRISVLSGFLGCAAPKSLSAMLDVLHKAARAFPEVVAEVEIAPGEVDFAQLGVRPQLLEELPQRQLSLRSIAFCYDFSVLFAAYMRLLVPGAALSVEAGSKRNADYGHVVLVLPGRAPLSLFRVATVLARKALRGIDVCVEVDRLITRYVAQSDSR